MVFICTCSQDTTTDILSPFLTDLPTFRFNIDKPEDYTWEFCRHGFAIRNVKTGASITSRTLSSFYLRKPIYFEGLDVPKEGSLADWCRKETDELFKDLYREYEANDQTVLVHSRNAQYGKLRQMRVAESYFKVADWHLFHGTLPHELTTGRWVAKSLTGTPIGKGKMFFVKEVNPTRLDLGYPWFLQKKIIGEAELTVVYINGRLFAYRYPRSAINDCEDVRKATLEDASKWIECELSQSERNSIRGFMAETGYSFGRFDFIRKDGELWFLEMNPNGQWAWLDEKNENGLISAIAEEIIAEDRAHQHDTVADSIHAAPKKEPWISRRRLRII